MERLAVKAETAARMLGVTAQDVRKFRDAGLLQSVGASSGMRIVVSSIEALKVWRSQPDYVPPGFVYLIRLGQYHKIGVSRDVRRRMNALQGGHPDRLDLILSIPTNNMRRAERQFHELFADKHIRGEWFDLADQDIAVMRKYEALIF